MTILSETPINPHQVYRASDLIHHRYTPYKDPRSVRAWMLRHGGKREGKRVVLIVGSQLIKAISEVTP